MLDLEDENLLITQKDNQLLPNNSKILYYGNNPLFNSVVEIVKNKSLINFTFYIFVLFTVITHSRLLLYGTVLICSGKIYKLYKNNKKNMLTIANYILV